MNKRLSLPEIPDAERTPLVDALLGIIESLSETVQRQDEEIGCLKDEIAILKGEKARPKFKPSGMAQASDAKPASETGDAPNQRAGSQKERLATHAIQDFADETAWQAHLAALGIDQERHRRIASEGIQCGCLVQNERWQRLVIVSDDAGQFHVPRTGAE